MRISVVGLACSALFALVASGGAAEDAVGLAQAAPPVAQATSLEARADEVAREALASGPFPGMAIAVSRNGKIIYQKGFGVAEVETGRSVTANTRFPIGSITKPITCRAVQMLAAQGKIDIRVGTQLAHQMMAATMSTAERKM
ncbi:MAG: serine hydrolase domain-containing protein, partial [Erythrobacter sp.]